MSAESLEVSIGTADPNPEQTNKDKLSGKKVGKPGSAFADIGMLEKPSNEIGQDVFKIPASPKSSAGKLPKPKAPGSGE